MTTLADSDHDHESTRIELLDHSSSHTSIPRSSNTKHHWRQFFLVFRAHAHLFSIIHKGNNIPITDIPSVSSDDESSSYTTLPNDNDGVAHLEVRLNIHNSNNNNNDDNSNSNRSSSSSENYTADDVPLPTIISIETLSSIVKEKNLVSLWELGGVEEVVTALDINLEGGIDSEAEDLHHRLEGQITPSKSFFHFVSKALRDWTVILLFCCAALSFLSGIIEEGLKNGWYDGTILFITVVVLVAATSIKSYWVSCKSQKLVLNRNRLLMIGVLKQGQLHSIPYSEVDVGDVVILNPGEWVPADGLFINGENLKVDDGVLHHYSTISCVDNPFLYYSAKVIEGSGHMLVTSAGLDTALGKTMTTVNKDTTRK